jgi:hypothetical protein
MIELFNGALTINQTLMRGLRESPDVVRRGLLLVLFVGALVGAVQGASAAINTASPERRVAAVRAQVDEFQRQLVASPNADQQVIQALNANKEPFLQLVEDVLTLPTPLPRGVGVAFEWLASVVSTPLGYLASLLALVVATHIVARQLGGQASIQQMLGLGALSVAPRALDALTFIPGIGPTIGFIAWAWGLVVFVVATAVAHKLDSGKAAIAVLLLPLLLSLLGLLALCVLLAVSVAAAGGA